ncbi:Transglutaminase-like enzyme, putative cysteine protease [Pseudoxanthomonas sp. GM95]|uniref:transglutaminase-like domain-containing protein n=1 Tax=Pseudoxanthomonas sp. GM95 TaxID=1881043 RepID=UPI0008B23DFA|nr:transglutaminase family protein [Pseudoxanthomonas sp. GM95]SEL57555.1 Transglutaminase-like enzyme, putative cysteine protease [Pseudoxanthomonas sp. GM95]
MKMLAGCELLLEAEAPSPVVSMLRPRDAQCVWRVDGRTGFQSRHAFEEYLDTFGNFCQRFWVPEGQMRVSIEATLDADDALAFDEAAGLVTPFALPAQTLQFTLPSRYCASDRPELLALATKIVNGFAPGYAQVEAIRAWIRQNIEYRYGVSDAHSCARDTIEQRVGVCRDFAHVGIALCRALDIPARMVVGWLHGLEPMDLHAWFEAYVGDAWYTFDATQPERRAGRAVIGYGRDAADVAFLMSYGSLKTLSVNVWTRAEQAQFA